MMGFTAPPARSAHALGLRRLRYPWVTTRAPLPLNLHSLLRLPREARILRVFLASESS